MATKKGTFQDYQGNELRPDLSAQELLDKIKTVDGTGSGLDADLLDGKEASSLPNRLIHILLLDITTMDLCHPRIR